VAVLAAFATWIGLADRSAAALSGDASVTNRLDLWGAGLQMAYENPAGFGAGSSGSEFMAWYQPIERTEGYRTMVNSYLTFLVERGWLPFAAALFGFFLFWNASASGSDPWGVATALRGTVLAFAVAGVFSTTMEDTGLWIVPGAAAIGLCALAGKHWNWPAFGRSLRRTALATGRLVAGLFAIGASASQHDPLVRVFSGGQVAAIKLRDRVPKEIVAVFPDPDVMGERPGKLVRRLVTDTGVCALLRETGQVGAPTFAFVAGRSLSRCGVRPTKGWLLLAPAIPTGRVGELPAGLTARPVTLFLPEIDEDGRTTWWREWAKGSEGGTFPTHILGGVGTQIDWAWDDVVEEIRRLL
jgi:hypothetical protein